MEGVAYFCLLRNSQQNWLFYAASELRNTIIFNGSLVGLIEDINFLEEINDFFNFLSSRIKQLLDVFFFDFFPFPCHAVFVFQEITLESKKI